MVSSTRHKRVRIFSFPLVASGCSVLAWVALSPLFAEPPAGWKLVFSDEFAGDTLDPDKWSTTMEFVGTHGQRYHNEFYLSYTCDDEVVIRDGMLRLRTDRRTVEGAETPTIWDYTQGFVSSHDKFSFTHGYIEVRARYPGGSGLWPCIWLMPQSQIWPPEFDIAEYYANRRTMHHGLAHGTMREPQWDSTRNNEVDFEADFHVFALQWMPGRAVWSVDSQPVKTVTADYVPNVPMYIILSNGVSSRFGPSGTPDENTVFPNAFEIDHVRVYQPAAPAGVEIVKNEEPPKKESALPLPRIKPAMIPLPAAP